MLFVEVFDVRGQVRREKTKTDGCLFTWLAPTMPLLMLSIFFCVRQSIHFVWKFLVMNCPFIKSLSSLKASGRMVST